MTKNYKHHVLLLGLAACFILSTLLYSKLPWLSDDGAFFLRYAVNMTHGAFWKYNIQDTPIWGASAPLWPLLIAPFIKLGLDPVFSIHLISACCCLASILLIAIVINKRFNLWISIAWIIFIGLDERLLHFNINGMETPLTVLLLSLAFAILICNIKNSYVLALCVALLAIHKIDLIPCAIILYFVVCFQNKKYNGLSLLLISLITFAWYGFAWYYFGAPIPNSFITKALHQDQLPHIIGHMWFIGFMLHSSKIGLALFLPSVYFSWKNNKYFTTFALSIMAIHTLAYSIKPPFEPYEWYIMPTLYAFWAIIAFGLGCMLQNYKMLRPYCVIILAALYLFSAFPNFVNATHHRKKIDALYDQDRALAGIWVNVHTQADATVYTGWGLPAYYSQRYVYDLSFLNRHYESTDLVTQYQPDILILQGIPFDSSSKQGGCYHSAMDSRKDYSIVKTFTDTYKADKNANYCFFVAKRKDVSLT